MFFFGFFSSFSVFFSFRTRIRSVSFSFSFATRMWSGTGIGVWMFSFFMGSFFRMPCIVWFVLFKGVIKEFWLSFRLCMDEKVFFFRGFWSGIGYFFVFFCVFFVFRHLTWIGKFEGICHFFLFFGLFYMKISKKIEGGGGGGGWILLCLEGLLFRRILWRGG